MVFLKTNIRNVFYRVSDTSTTEFSAIEAFHFFKADKNEQAVERIDQHHKHVEKACKAFRKAVNQQIASDDLVETSQQNALGAQVATAVALINTFLNEVQDASVRLQIAQLQSLARDGVITDIPKRLQRMSKQLRRGTLSHDEALDEIVTMARKYNDYFVAEEERRSRPESAPQIILSESFR